MICQYCGQTFDGRPNKRYCRTYCRRRVERIRKNWDKRERRAARLEFLAEKNFHRRREFLEYAAHVRAHNGPRP